MMVPKNGSTWLVEASRMVPVSLDYKVRVCMPTSVAHFSSSTVLLPTNGRRELTSARPGWIVDRTTWSRQPARMNACRGVWAQPGVRMGLNFAQSTCAAVYVEGFQRFDTVVRQVHVARVDLQGQRQGLRSSSRTIDMLADSG
ncbi:hypothetical protein THAOC_28607, partial [Thalassiosira oceanica]